KNPRPRPLTDEPPAGTERDCGALGADCCGAGAGPLGGFLSAVPEPPLPAPLRADEDAVRAAAAGFSTIRIGSRSAGSGVNVDSGKAATPLLAAPAAAREAAAGE